MAFIEIVKGKEKRLVSKASFENFFKDNGWKMAGEIPASSINQNVQNEKKSEETIKSMVDEEELNTEHSGESDESIKDEWDEAMEEDEEEVEKPISEMTRNELVEYAKANDISLAGLNKTSQFREAIREAIKGR